MITPKYKPTDLQIFTDKCADFIKEYCIKNKKVPSIIGLLNYLDLSENNIQYYKRTKEYKEFYKVYQYYKQRIKQVWVEGLYDKVDGRKWYLANAFRMEVNKVSSENTPKIIIENKSGLDLKNSEQAKNNIKQEK